MESMESNKQAAESFLKLVTQGLIDEAYERHVDLDGRHHNLFFAKGMDTLREAMKANEAASPNKHFNIKHLLAEGDLVVAHSHLKFQVGDPGMVTVHVMRFRDGKIVEFWDCGQAIPPDCPNKDGAF